MHPFTHAQTAAEQERKSIVQPQISSAKGNSAVMENDTMPVVVLFVPCAMFMRVYQDGGGDIKAWSGLRQPTLLSSPVEGQLFWRCKFLLAHRNTGRRGFRHPPSYHNADCSLRRSKLVLSKLPPCLCCIWVRHQICCGRICAGIFFNSEIWGHMNLTTSCKGCCRLSLHSCVIFKRSVCLRNHLKSFHLNMAGTFRGKRPFHRIIIL